MAYPPATSLPRIMTTQQAATFLNRAPQTLRTWASKGNGPIKPRRINGRLAWLVDDLRRLLEGGK